MSDEGLAEAVSEVRRVLVPGGTLYLRCFAEGDLRSGGKKEDMRNGIAYRYWSLDDVKRAFPSDSWEIVSAERIDSPTRFGGVRRRLECVIRRID
ncbi:hypothetical protein AUQ37_08675 [Candidatus Methanomethylophilus sp. 1R26]|uniref:hypothetical protein n=1 Tax=Candidatus Methanomethylophilus sp. 1R26 TaxID=1769296 RepID=UPI000737A465|nr:hypothetical protein [Candidatus Methanomethylophilus sp. 1R26]KUE73519.1 hypothetical protein AUQ37_08675 [Candidatus Methanomethylophilus sp. 1R26]